MNRATACVSGFFFCIILMGCAKQERNVAQGYVEGWYTYIATPVSGNLEKLYVDKGYQVKQGQLLFELDRKPEIDAYHAALQNYQQSKSARDAIIADLAYTKVTLERNKILVARRVLQQSEPDSPRSHYDSDVAKLAQAEAAIDQANAQLAQAKWSLDQKAIVAPVDAVVFDRYYRIGEYTVAQQPVLSLLAPADIRAVFYINATIIGALRLNDKVTVRCDHCTQDFTGRISFISPTAEYTPPVIYSTETNDKLIFRVEAMFPTDQAIQMHPGQPIYVTYYPHER